MGPNRRRGAATIDFVVMVILVHAYCGACYNGRGRTAAAPARPRATRISMSIDPRYAANVTVRAGQTPDSGALRAPLPLPLPWEAARPRGRSAF